MSLDQMSIFLMYPVFQVDCVSKRNCKCVSLSRDMVRLGEDLGTRLGGPNAQIIAGFCPNHKLKTDPTMSFNNNYDVKLPVKLPMSLRGSRWYVDQRLINDVFRTCKLVTFRHFWMTSFSDDDSTSHRSDCILALPTSAYKTTWQVRQSNEYAMLNRFNRKSAKFNYLHRPFYKQTGYNIMRVCSLMS